MDKYELYFEEVLKGVIYEGKKAENKHGAVIEYSSSDMRIKYSVSGETVKLDRLVVGSLWRFLPNYVSFAEAMKAFSEGKTVSCESLIYVPVRYERGDETTHYVFTELQIKSDKWTIED